MVNVITQLIINDLKKGSKRWAKRCKAMERADGESFFDLEVILDNDFDW